jgi:3-dehydro-4-phosphotetronate decarboxylase
MEEQALAAEICWIGRSLFERGYVHATAGNISARLADGGMLITPTDASLGRLEPHALARIAADGTQRSGERASKTAALHRRIYATAPHAQCIIHTHSTHLVALTLAGVWRDDDVLPPLTPYYAMKVGHVPLIPYERPGDPQVAEWVAARIEASASRSQVLHAVLLDRLGPVVWGATLKETSAAMEELEETAKLWMLSGRSVSPLNDAALQTLREKSAARW